MMTITQILPHRVKPSELTMINSVWINLRETPDEFVDSKDLTYLWVMRREDVDYSNTVILGIEEPWRYRHCFHDSVQGTLDDMESHFREAETYWKARGEKDGMGGHPTLAAWFSENGQASCHAGLAYIGGELSWKGSNWVLSNKSGRFGRGKGIDALPSSEIQTLLTQAAGIINQTLGFHPTLEIITK